MQRGDNDDVFEDFASDSDDRDNTEEEDGDYDFDDEHIASVLELMDEGVRSSTALSAISEEENSSELSTSSSGVYAAAGRNGSGEDTAALRPLTSVADPTPRTPADIPSALSLLDELFPSLDPLASLTSESAIDSPRHQRTTISGPPSPLLSVDRSFEPVAWTARDERSLQVVREGTSSSENSSRPLALVSPSTSSNSAACDDQKQRPEWMQDLLGEMYKQSMSPRAIKSAKAPASVMLKHEKDFGEVVAGRGEWVADEMSPQLLSALCSSAAAVAETTSFREEILSPSSSKLAPEEPLVLEIDSTLAHALSSRRSACSEPSSSSSRDGNTSRLSLAWGKFSPDMMPTRCSSESLPFLKTGGGSSSKSDAKRPCYVPMLRSQKRRPRPRVVTPADAELTFRPTINTRYLARLRSRRTVLGEAFARRMATDIQQRQERKFERAKALDERAKQVEEQQQMRHKSLVGKGSERILQRNGLWEEPLAKRLERLVLGSAKQQRQQRSGKNTSEKSRLRQQKRRQRAEAVASQACESLYQRGLDKKRRDARRELENVESLRELRVRRKMTARSRLVIKKKLRAELELVCANQRQQRPEEQEEEETPGASHRKSSCSSSTSTSISSVQRVSFVEFSCALLYFGLVPELETRWRGDENVTLLWHAWRCFVGQPNESDSSEGDGRSEDHPGNEQTLAMNTLEGILARVMQLDDNETSTSHRQKPKQRRVSDDKEDRELLFQLFRANYISRERSQTLAIRRMYDDTDTSSPASQQRQQQSSVQRNTPRTPRRTYSLHGKPMDTTSTAHDDPLLRRQRATAAKLSALRREKESLEVAECTFQPRVSASPMHASAAWSCDLRLLSASGRQYKSTTAASTFDRLYNDAFQRQNNVLDKYLQAKLEEDERRKKLAAISPGFVNGQSAGERLCSLQRALASNPLPVNFHKTIDTMRAASERKAQERAECAKRLQPVHFARSNDGRTLVVPFQFATDLRASQPLRRSGQAASRELRMKTTRALVRSAVSTLGDSAPLPRKQQQQQQQQQEDEEEEEGEAAADFCLDVHLSPSRVRPLYFCAHDDPKALVAVFAARFGLAEQQQRALERVVRAHLEELVDLQL